MLSAPQHLVSISASAGSNTQANAVHARIDALVKRNTLNKIADVGRGQVRLSSSEGLIVEYAVDACRSPRIIWQLRALLDALEKA